MDTVYLRRGEFRICPRCSSRQKGLQRKCDQCGASLDGAQIASRAYVPTPGPHPLRSNKGLRAMLVLAVVGATLIGVVLRNTFSGAAIDDAVASTDQVRAQARAEVAGPDPTVYERNAVTADSTAVPEGWYGLATRSMPPPPPSPGTPVVVEQGAYTVDPAAVGGMVGITPGSSGLGRRVRPGTTFTNADLATIRTASVAPPLVPPAAPLDDRALVDQQRRRDAENDLRAAQSKLEVLRMEADVLRREGAGVSDPERQQQHQRRLQSLLDDLQNAERDVARAERKLREG